MRERGQQCILFFHSPVLPSLAPVAAPPFGQHLCPLERFLVGAQTLELVAQDGLVLVRHQRVRSPGVRPQARACALLEAGAGELTRVREVKLGEVEVGGADAFCLENTFSDKKRHLSFNSDKLNNNIVTTFLDHWFTQNVPL